MDKIFAHVICFLLIAALQGRPHAAVTPEQYWRSILPNTQIPYSISQLLGNGYTYSPAAGLRKGKAAEDNINYAAGLRKGKAAEDNINYAAVLWKGKAPEDNINYAAGLRKGKAAEDNINYAARLRKGKAAEDNINYAAGLPKGKAAEDNINYAYAATQQTHIDPSMALYFFEKNLQQGKKFTLTFNNMMTGTKFLPRGEADSFPFSSNDLTKILARFAVPPGSDDTVEVRHTLHLCEQPANRGEKKSCATSLESMVDFATSSLGTRDVDAASTVLASKDTESQEYTVTSVRRIAGTGQLVACHPLSYMYAVFLCHRTEATRAYTVSMVSKDGTAVEGAAVCHTDTADWNPDHVSFKVLGVKPGTVPVCHFMQPDAVIWTRRA